jgi:hypothetical protein
MRSARIVWILSIVGALAAPGTARATLSLQQRAIGLGYPAQECTYCHTFSMAHMQKRARELGITSMNCLTCHGNKLPKSGPGLFNARGKWLLAEKTRREAKQIDPAWLKGFVESKPDTKEHKPPP